jgi:hypothetical protein
LKAPGSKRLKLEHDKLLSNFAFNFNVRRYSEDSKKGKTTARRMIFTFALDAAAEGESSSDGGLNFWKFRVMGHASFWRLGGILALVNKATNVDACAIRGGCDMRNCVNKQKNEFSGAQGCIFDVNLLAGGAYIGYLYGASDVVIEVGRCRLTLSNPH